mmetsp:Transcript_72684/g.188715  ORF Transcript_72684/g.188715 Transcript_72684/m.188715 type:complete len:200 (-) Transcript_72684:1258-1857(-)
MQRGGVSEGFVLYAVHHDTVNSNEQHRDEDRANETRGHEKLRAEVRSSEEEKYVTVVTQQDLHEKFQHGRHHAIGVHDADEHVDVDQSDDQRSPIGDHTPEGLHGVHAALVCHGVAKDERQHHEVVSHVGETQCVPLRLSPTCPDRTDPSVLLRSVVDGRQQNWLDQSPPQRQQEALNTHVVVLRDPVRIPASHAPRQA